ncbi:MAG: hypothetical protein ACRCT1_08040 [Microcoleaceae cyanobacterium]
MTFVGLFGEAWGVLVRLPLHPNGTIALNKNNRNQVTKRFINVNGEGRRKKEEGRRKKEKGKRKSIARNHEL